MSNPNTFRQVGAGKNFLSPTDFIIQVDTSAGAVTLVLPKIATILASYPTIFQYMGVRFSDISNNASVNNITIEGFETDKINGQSTIVLSNNGDGGVLTLIGENQWSFEQNTSSGGGSESVDILYADLYDSIINQTLVKGQKYRLTDYRSVNFLNGWEIANNNPIPIDPSFDPQQIHTGENEVLILEAISNYQLNPVCNSEKFSQDILQFQAYTNKIGVDVDIYTGKTLPDSSVVSDFNLKWDGTNVYFDMPTGYPALFGHYFYLYAEFDGGNYYQDGVFEPLTPVIAECQYPFTSNEPIVGYPKQMSRLSVSSDGMKVILLDLVEADYLNYDADTLYVDTIYAIGDAYGWVTRRNDTQKNINVPFDFRNRIYRRYEVNLSSINSGLGTNYYGIGDNFLGLGTTGNYIDVPSIDGQGFDCYNIEWNGIGGADMYWYAGYSDNNVFLESFVQILIDDNCYNNSNISNFTRNRIGVGFYGNVIGYDFYDNTIEDYFFQNRIGYSFGNNIIDTYFYYNNIIGSFSLNQIGVNFANNTIAFGFTYNIIGFFAQSNIIGTDFSYNKIYGQFQGNNVGNTCRMNVMQGGLTGSIIKDNFQNNYFSEYCYNLTINTNNFRNNQILYPINNVNFNASTYVYGDYSCSIIKGSNGTFYISYFDGVSQQNITPINS